MVCNIYIYIYIYIYDEKHVCGYIRCEFIHWAIWRTLMQTEYFLFVHYTTSILAKPSTWCFEHSGDISYSLLIDPNLTDESWEGRNTCLLIYTLWIYSLSTLRTRMRTEYFLFAHHTTSILASLSTWWFEHSDDISCSLLINLSHTDESWDR